MDWCVTFPKEPVLIWRPSLHKACGGNRNAAKFLAYLLYRASIREEAKIEAQNINEVRKAQGLAPDQDTTITIYRTQGKIYEEMDGELSDRTLRDDAIPCLVELGYLTYFEYKGNKNYTAYTIYPDAIQQGIDRSEIIPNHTTLNYYQRLQVNRKKFRAEKIPHDSEMFPNRSGNSSERFGTISERKRGRKPRPDAPQEPQSEEAQINIEIDSKIGNREEGSATSAEDRTAHPLINLEMKRVEKRETNPRMPAINLKGQHDHGTSHSSTGDSSVPGGLREDLPRSRGGDTPLVVSNPIIHTHNPYYGLDPYPFGYRSDLIDADPINQEAWRKALIASQQTVTEGLPAPAASTALVSSSPLKSGVQQGAMAMTARQIKAQAERREKELWAIIEEERNTKYSETQRKLYENKEGMKCLIADDISDEALRTGLQALDAFQRKSFTVLKFYGWMPNLEARAPTPITNGKAPYNGVNHELNQRKLEERKARLAAHG